MDNFENDIIFVKKYYDKEILNERLTLGKIYRIDDEFKFSHYHFVSADDDKLFLYPKSGFLTTKEAIRETINK